MLNVHVFWLLPVIASVNMIFFALGVNLLSRSILGTEKYALVLFLTFLFLWNDPRGMSPFYHFGFVPLSASYPFRFVLAISLLFMASFTENISLLLTAIYGLALAFLYLSHPVMCSFLIMFLVMKVLLTRSSSLVRRLYFLTVLLLSAAVGVWAWPFFPAAQAVLSSPKYGDLQFAGHWTLLYENALWKTFPAWVGYFYFAYRLCRKNFCFITISAFFALLIYLLNFLIFRNTVLSRFIVFIAFFGHIGMVLTLKHLERHKLYFHSLITFLVLLLLFGHRHLARYGKQVGLTWDILRKEPVLSHSNIAIYRELSTLDPYISASTVVLAPMYVSWYLPGVLGCRVVASEHSDPFMTDFFERKDVVLKFFETDIPDAKRLNILSAYKVTHVLIPASYQYRLANFSKFLAPMLDTPTYKLYFVRQ